MRTSSPFLLALVAALLGCGARTPLDDGATASDSDPQPAHDVCIGDPSPLPDAPCTPLSLPLSVVRACELTTCDDVDAEASLSLHTCTGCTGDGCTEGDSVDHQLLVMNRLGKGHVLAWCDSTTAVPLLSSFRPFEYLGRSANPRVASIGWHPCNVGIEGATYLGERLPGAYTNAAALAADYDLLVACGAGPHGGVLADFGPSFRDIAYGFVHDEGRGLLAVYDYRCADEAPEPSLEELNDVVGRAGFLFSPINLGEQPSQTVDLGCVEDYPP